MANWIPQVPSANPLWLRQSANVIKSKSDRGMHVGSGTAGSMTEAAGTGYFTSHVEIDGTLYAAGIALPTFTQGSVLFAGASGAITEDNANLFWDNTNNRLGILDATPSNTLSVGAASEFQVSSAGAIAAATGITSSGTITFSGLTADRLVVATTGGQLTNTITSANLILSVSDETGSGSLVFATSPTLVTPLLGIPTSGTLTNCTGLPISTGVSGLGTGVATFLATPSSANLLAAVTDETGTGALVFGTAPTFTTSITDPLVVGGTGTTSTLILRSTSGVGAAGADIIFQTGNNGATEAMRILNSGNLGIGTTGPLSKLHILSSGTQNVANEQDNGSAIVEGPNVTAASAIFNITSNTAAAVDVGGTIGLGGLYRTGTLDAAQYAVIRGAKENGTDANYAGYLSFSTRPMSGSFTERLRIDSAGNVGLGVTPVYRVDIAAAANSAQVVNIRNTTAGTAALAGYQLGTDEVPVTGTVVSTGSLYNTAIVNAWDPANVANSFNLVGARGGGTNLIASNGPIRFYAGNATGERMRVHSDGNVGIETASPVSKLDVVDTGTATIRGITSGQYNTGTQGALFSGRKARGTLASPLAIANGDYITALTASAYDGTSYLNGLAAAGFRVNGTVATGSIPTDFVVLTGSTDSGSTERMRILSGGNVGIGDATPTAVLDIAPGTARSGSSGTTNGWLSMQAGTYTDSATAGSGTATSFAFNAFATPTLAATNTLVTTTDAATVYIAAAPANGTNMTITNPWALWVDAGNSRFDGKIVVGSTSGVTPLGILDVYRETAVTNTYSPIITIVAKTSGGAMADGFGTGIQFALGDTDTSPANVANIGAIRDGADNSAKIVFQTANAGSFGTRMVIDASGDVGIGETAPLQVLHTKTTGVPGFRMERNVANISFHGLGQIEFAGDNSTNGTASRVGTRIDAIADSNWNNASANYAGTTLRFFTQDSTTTDTLATARMVISSTGNVVIGATAAGATAAGVLALSNAATAPTASANLVHLYSEDVSASAVLAIYQETAPVVASGIASTHKVQVRINGASYFIMLSNV